MMEYGSPLQGSLGYLLAGEITVVTGLTLTLIKLILVRLRSGEQPAEESPVVAVPSQEIVPLEVEKTPQYLELLAKLQALEVEKVNLLATAISAEEASKLKEKIVYLETKLVEYEIVQEEIGALGDLKAENEKLKTELVGLKNAQLGHQTETLIKEQFKDFADPQAAPVTPSAEPVSGEPLPGELQTLLSDIDSLAQNKDTQKKS